MSTDKKLCGAESNCPCCQGALWVCENHRGLAWEEPGGCDCGAGVPCVCNEQALNPPGFKTIAAVDGSSVEEWLQ